jgi:hypothetical protein
MPKINKKGERIYGAGVGVKGSKEDPAKCVKEVQSKFGFFFYQCDRKRGHGKDGLYCWQHAKGTE